MKGPGRVEVEEFPRPEVERGAVLMQVLYSGICGTDKHTFRGETIQYAGTPHERRLEYPLICGHENVGVVVDTGGDVLATDGRPLRPGDRIVPGANVACGECWFCREGFPYYACERLLGCGELIAVDLLPSRLRVAERFGATLTIEASAVPREGRIELVRQQTGGRGADVVIDCSGVAETFPEALTLVRWGGTVIEAGAFVDLGPVPVNPNRDICTRNSCVLGRG